MQHRLINGYIRCKVIQEGRSEYGTRVPIVVTVLEVPNLDDDLRRLGRYGSWEDHGEGWKEKFPIHKGHCLIIGSGPGCRPYICVGQDWYVPYESVVAILPEVPAHPDARILSMEQGIGEAPNESKA